jgi:peptide/nickel transport system permease protein
MLNRYVVLFILGTLLALACSAPPYDVDAINLALRHAPPSWEHLLGTDHLGRDMLSRMMEGGQRTLLVLVIVAATSFIGGSIAGTLAAVSGGWREQAILRVAEMSIVVPTLILALTAAALFGLSPMSAGLALGLSGIGPFALLTHALARRTLAEPYMMAARGLGVSQGRIIARHLLPNMAPIMLTQIGSTAGLTIVAYASLSFIGLGADTSKPDWGSMLFEYRMFIFENPLLMFWPGAAIACIATALNMTFDPPDRSDVERLR